MGKGCATPSYKRPGNHDLYVSGREAQKTNSSIFFQGLQLYIAGAMNIPSLKLTVRSCKEATPKGNDHLPTIHFQVLLLLVSGRLLGGSTQLVSG